MLIISFLFFSKIQCKPFANYVSSALHAILLSFHRGMHSCSNLPPCWWTLEENPGMNLVQWEIQLLIFMATCPFDIPFFYIYKGSSELLWFLLRKVSLNLGRNWEHFFLSPSFSSFPDVHVYRTRVHSGSQCCSAWPDLNPVLFCISQYFL